MVAAAADFGAADFCGPHFPVRDGNCAIYLYAFLRRVSDCGKKARLPGPSRTFHHLPGPTVRLPGRRLATDTHGCDEGMTFLNGLLSPASPPKEERRRGADL